MHMLRGFWWNPIHISGQLPTQISFWIGQSYAFLEAMHLKNMAFNFSGAKSPLIEQQFCQFSLECDFLVSCILDLSAFSVTS